MLESYISPFLLGYVDKYIKNLKPEDLRLSLWGGDLVLNNLELRLDALERDLNLPLSFVSGFIHELRIHVPWTRIGYEPVEISINTIECTVKLRDAEVDDNDSVSSKSSTSTNKSRTESGSKVKPKVDVQDASLSPGYVTSLMNRVLHNVHVSIKNLILKYVEDDIVLSVNVQSFDTFATDSDWQKAYLELSLPELVLRRVCKFSDITVCLDKRNASGKIEVYQEPVTFRCGVTTRMHMTYNSLNAKRVSAVKVSTLCEELKMSLSDTQLPMFLRVLQLVLALYYGSITVQSTEMEAEQSSKEQETNQTAASVLVPADNDDVTVDLDPSSTWTSWAWSFVPEALTYDDDEDQEEGAVNRYGGGKLQKRQDPILSIGFFCDKAVLEFKVTDPVSERSLYTRPKLSFQQTMIFELDGIAIDILLKGEGFFAAQLGISHMRLSGLGSCPCGVHDHPVKDPEDHNCYIKLGDADYKHKANNYLSLTLFDNESPENNYQKTIYILDGEHHRSVYTEKNSMKKYGAFWMDYLYTYEKLRGLNGNDSSSRSSHHSDTDPIFTTKENSWKRFVFAPTSLNLNSSFVHRLQQFMFYAGNHDYEPYSIPQPEIVDEKRPVPTPEQVAGLEDSIPQRHSHYAILGLDVTVKAAEHGDYDPTGSNEESGFVPVVPDTAIPAVRIQCDRGDYQVTMPMYARQLIAAASKVSHPSSTLLHHCYSQTSIKVFGLQAGLTFDPLAGDLSPPYLKLLQPCSFAGLSKSLCLPMYWTDQNIAKSEMMLEVPSIGLDFTKAQLLILIYIQHSWMGKHGTNKWLLETNLMQDVFTTSGCASPDGQAGLVVYLSSLEYRYVINDCVKAISGSIGQAKIAIKDVGEDVPTPVFEGPLKTDKYHLTSSIVPSSRTTASVVTSPRTNTACLLTVTAQIPLNDKHKGSLGALLLNIEGTSLCLDPVLYTWLLYQPSRRPVATHNSRDSPDRAEKSISTEIRSPAKKVSSQGSETYKAPKSGSKFSKQKSLTATAVMEDGEVNRTEASSQTNHFDEIIGKLKEMIIQVDVSPCIIAWPTKHLAFPSPDLTIPQCLCDLVTSVGGQGSPPLPPVLVVCVPSLSVHSSGHKAVDPDQDIPLSRMDLPQEPGEKFPWTIKAQDFAIYSLLDFQRVYYLLKPMAISTTLALTANKHPPTEAEEKPSLGLGVHTDMPAVILQCSDAQVTLVLRLLQGILDIKQDLGQAFNVTNSGSSSAPASTLLSSPRRGGGGHTPVTPSSPSKSVPPFASSTTTSSQASSGGMDSTVEMQSVSMPSEAPPSSHGGGAGSWTVRGGVKLSLWLQWTLHKLSVVVYGKEKMSDDKLVKLCADMEDLTASFDLQDVYSKVTCKVGALNIHHFSKGDNTWTPGPFKGVLLSCTDTMSHNVEMSPPFKRLRTNSQPTNPFSLHSSKAAESKQTHAFMSLTWTRALGTSVAQKMSGGKPEKQGDGSKTSEDSLKQKRFVNEVIVSSQAFDVIVWCPIVASTLDVLMAGLSLEGSTKPDSAHAPKKHDFKMHTIPEAKHEGSNPSDAMSWQSMSHRSNKTQKSFRSLKSSQSSSGIADWLTSSNLPLIYLDCKEIRTFVPAGPVSDQHRPRLLTGVAQDLFLFQISQISLVPYADNPLQRLVVKQDTYRKATVAGMTQQPGSDVEDRQYQLDVNGISLNVASWEQVMRSSEQGRMKVASGVTRSKTQNPALEWNLSLPTKDPEEVKLIPVIQDFDLRLVAAPAIVMEKTKVDKPKQKVVICGHSVEFNVSTDLNLYLSTEQVHLARKVLDSNLHHLLQGSTTTTTTDHTHPHHQQPTDATRPSTSLEDSGLGSDCCPHSPTKEFTDATRQTITSPPRSSQSNSAKSVAMETGDGKPKKKSKMKGVTPFDFLMTGRKITLFLYSSKTDLKSKSSSQRDSTLPPSEPTPCPTVLEPFVLLALSQPSLVMSVEKQTQKLELSFYDFSIDGAAMNKQVRDHSLPQAMDYPVPWFQTCPGVPDPKTGVKPAVFTFTVTDFMMQSSAAVKLMVLRPLKVNFSLTKIQQAREYARRLQPIRTQELTKVPLGMEEIRLMTTPRSGEKSVGISLPGQQTGQRTKPRKPAPPPQGVLQNLMILSHFQSALVVTSQMLVVIATTPEPDYPHIVASVNGTIFESDFVVNEKTDEIFQADSSIQVYDFMIKTSLQQHTTPLLGPLTLDLQLRTSHEPHSASDVIPLLPRIFADLNIKNIPIYFGQENLNCLKTVTDRMSEVLGEGGKGSEKKQKVPAKKFQFKPDAPRARDSSDSGDEEDDDVGADDGNPEWEDVDEEGNDLPEGVTQIEYKDDLRTGAFEYFTEGHTEEEIPLPNQIFFTPPSQEGGHWGTMVWTYPEPRMDVGLTVTPVPISNPDVRPFARMNKIPCILQVYDVQRQRFFTVRQFFVSETERYQKKQKIVESRDMLEEMGAHSTWRVVLNTNMQREATQQPLNLPTPDVILTPMTLAASMRFDTIFAPRFISFCHLDLTVGLAELRLTNHLSQIGKGVPDYLKGFTPDGSTPRNHEFMVVRIPQTKLTVESYGGVHARTRVSGETELEMDLLNYHNLTMSPLLQSVQCEIGYVFRSLTDIEGTLSCTEMSFIAGQSTVHTLTKVAQAWSQNLKPEAERVFYGYYLICNSTNQALRFGQVHTDESVVLKSGEMHEYSWRTHKKEKQELHVCMENWRNFRWSEPFSIDGDDGDKTVRVLHNRDQTATLFIQVRKITALQRQIIITGTQTFTNQMTIPLEVQVTRRSSSQASPRSSIKDTWTLKPKSSLPALTCSDEDITGVCVKVQGSDCDWSEQFALSGEMCIAETVIKVPCSNGKRFYFWCQIFSEKHDGSTQRLVMFSPLFTVQSHLPFPITLHCQAARGNDTQVIEVKGQGSLQQLYQIPPLSWYNLTLASTCDENASSSSAAVCISTEMLENIAQHPDEAVGLKELSEGHDDLDLSKFWPYNHPDYTSSKLHASALQNITLTPPAHGLPSTSLQVGMVQHRSKVNTIRVEMMPCCMIVNETDMDFTIQEDGDETVKVKGGTTCAPQKFKAKLSVSLSHEGEDYVYNDLVKLLTDADTPPKKNEPVQGLQLQPEDHGTIELVSRSVHLGPQKVVHVALHSTVRHNIRILTLRPRLVFHNNSKHDVRIRLVNLRSEEKVSIQGNTLQPISLPSKASEHTIHLKWDSPACSQPTGSFHYLSLALSDQSAVEGAWLDEWSAWMKIDSNYPRVPVTVPILKPPKTFQSKSIVTCPMVVMVYEHESVTYVTFDIDPSPKVLVINRCPFPVHIGHSQEHAKVEEALEIEEENGPIPKIPTVPSGSVVHYNPPLEAQSKQSNVHKFHFAIAKPPGSVTVPSSQSLMEGGSKVEGQQWSEAVDILDSCNPTRSEIISMPSGGYLLVATECVGTLIHIFVDSLNSKDEQVEEARPDPPQISQSIGTAGIIVKVMDDLTPGPEVKEILRVTSKGVNVIMVAREDLKRTKALHAVHLISFAVEEIQIDNQSHDCGGYDFPVIFRGHKRSEDKFLPDIDHTHQLTPERWYNFVYAEAQESREQSFFWLHFFVEGNEGFGDRLRNAEVAFNNMEVYVEDQFLRNAKSLVKTYSPGFIVQKEPKPSSGTPSVVQLAIGALKSPIGLQQLTILPISLTASIHASLMMFISLDHTQLTFQRYETGPIYATHRQLGQALTLHYTSGALFKAGWAIGSLDLIGNPAGFLRSVRTGLFDTVYLPYEGLTRGPSAFVSGVASGMSSLVRHLSAGTLTSITKFASSMSRNLDRLSLDADHVARREEERRRVPEGMSSAIAQGLSSFGISMLGAIAGLADQPLRSFQEISSDSTVSSASPSQRARGVISGVGKGLVGAVVKPLGGAAELVAQTGQGILHGTGLEEKVTPIGKQYSEMRSTATNARLKYEWKMLRTLPTSEILYHVDITSTTVQGLQRGGALLLTPEVLYVVSSSEDMQQLTLPLCDIACGPVRFNEKGLKVVVKKTASVPKDKSSPAADRVADYVASTSDTSGQEDEPTPRSDSPSEGSGQRSQEVQRSYQYTMETGHREGFLAMFCAAKSRLDGVGFCYDETDNKEYRQWQLTAEKAKVAEK